jgi:hypothetical protein
MTILKFAAARLVVATASAQNRKPRQAGVFEISLQEVCRLFSGAFKCGWLSSSLTTGGLFTTFRIFSGATWTTRTRASAAAARLALTRSLSGLSFFFHGDLEWRAFDYWLRTATVIVGRLFIVITRLLHLRSSGTDCVVAIAVVVVAVNVVAIAFIVVVSITFVTLDTFLHMRLCGSNDAVVVFCVLQVVFSHNPVAGALRITGQSGIFFSNMLGSTADFYIRTGAVIGPSERIPALAVEVVITTTAIIVVIVVVISTPTAALILLSWPHQLLT